MTGSVSRSKNDPSQSLQMTERPLMTAEELKSLPKGDFIVMKTGVHPIRVHLKLFFKWGITFDEKHPYTIEENSNREVKYASKDEIIDGIKNKYPKALPENIPLDNDEGGEYSSPIPVITNHNVPEQKPPETKKKDESSGGSGLKFTDLPEEDTRKIYHKDNVGQWHHVPRPADTEPKEHTLTPQEK